MQLGIFVKTGFVTRKVDDSKDDVEATELKPNRSW